MTNQPEHLTKLFGKRPGKGYGKTYMAAVRDVAEKQLEWEQKAREHETARAERWKAKLLPVIDLMPASIIPDGKSRREFIESIDEGKATDESQRN